MEQMSYVFLGWLLSIAGMIIIERYRRRIRSVQVWNSIKLELRELRCLMATIASAQLFEPDTCYTVNEHSLPFLDAQTTDVGLLSMKRKQGVWRIKMHLDLFNQQIPFLRSQFDRTFDDSLSDTNREGIQTNLNVGYKRLEEKARLIAELISQAIDPAQ